MSVATAPAGPRAASPRGGPSPPSGELAKPGCDIHAHAHAQDNLYNEFVIEGVQSEVCILRGSLPKRCGASFLGSSQRGV